jgi:hypothetical protein
MSRCALNRWGPGTTCERPTNTEAAKEIQLKIKAMQDERAKQDSIWNQQGLNTEKQNKVNENNRSSLDTSLLQYAPNKK